MNYTYTLVAGYYAGKTDTDRAEFFDLWYSNVLQVTKNNPPIDMFIINAASECFPKYATGKWINLSANLGHVHDIDKNGSALKLGGWSMSFLMGCFLAYSNKTDLIYWEQDLLGFGPVIEQLYKDAEDQGVNAVVGRECDADGQQVEQSLFLIKNSLLLPFVKAYLEIQHPDGGPNYFLRPEFKFLKLIQDTLQGSIGRASFGYGRSRPKTLDETGPWYIQKITPTELQELRKKGLVYV